MTSELGELFADWADYKKEKRAHNRAASARLLDLWDIKYDVRNGGTHLIIREYGAYDFWPGTGLWMHRTGDKVKSRGVRKLVQHIEVQRDRTRRCPSCNAQNIRSFWTEEKFQYGSDPLPLASLHDEKLSTDDKRAPFISVGLPVRECRNCGNTYLDHIGMAHRQAAVNDFLGFDQELLHEMIKGEPSPIPTERIEKLISKLKCEYQPIFKKP